MAKAQSGMEYLYVFAISFIVILIVGSALFFLGVFNPSYDSSKTTEVWFANTRVGILDHSLRTNGRWVLKVINRDSEPINITRIDIGGYSFSISKIVLPDRPLYIYGINLNLRGNLSEEYRYNMTIHYKRKTLSHSIDGWFVGYYEPGNNTFVWSLSSGADFAEGTYINTTYGSVVLDGTNSSGQYISKVFDAGAPVRWSRIEWGPEHRYKVPYEPDNDTLLLYHFDELYGTIVDSSNSGNNGTNTGATYGVDGKFNHALYFDGNEKVDVAENTPLSLNSSFSYGAWFKPASISTWQGVMSRMRTWGQGYNLQVGTSNRIACGWGVYTSSDIVPTTDKWYFAVCVYNGSCMRLYVNGILQSDIDCGTMNVSTNNMSIGVFYTPGSLYFNGTIDEVFVENRTLSADEIEDMYIRGISYLNASVRSCDDINCTGDSWSSEIIESSDLSLSNNRYFQFKFNFYTENITYGPILHNVSVYYSVD